MNSNIKHVRFRKNINNAVRALKFQNKDKWRTGANKNKFKRKGCTEVCLYFKENITKVILNVCVRSDLYN